MADFKKILSGVVLASSLLLAACGGEPGKVYPKNISRDGESRSNPNRNKSEPASKFQTAHIAGTSAIALFQLDRAIDLALNKERAKSFDAQNDCQKIASNTGATIVQVETDATSCRKSNSSVNWSGTERIELSGSTDGLFDSLTTSARTYALSLNTSNREHDLEVKISVKKAASSSPGNRITYDFTEEVIIESRGEDSIVAERRRKLTNEERNAQRNRANGNSDDDDEEVTRSRSSQKIKTVTTITLSGQLEINKVTKALSGLRLEPSSIEVKRTATPSNSNVLMTSSKLDLIPKSTTLSETTCGRIAADFGYNQSVTIPNGQKEDRNGTLNFAINEIQAAQSPTFRLATCQPGFKTLMTDLEVVANSLFKNFGK